MTSCPPPSQPLSFDDDSEPEYHQLFEYVFVVGLKEKAGASNKGKLTTELTYNFPPAVSFFNNLSFLRTLRKEERESEEK